jgi:hypothetical protein
MYPVGFEPTIPAGERPPTHALDRAATVTGSLVPVWYEAPLEMNEGTPSGQGYKRLY